MSDKSMQTVDLLISHTQIVLRSRDYDEKLSQWGKGVSGEKAMFLKVLFYTRIILYSIHYQRTRLEQTSISK